jgi:hypothetical protein
MLDEATTGKNRNQTTEKLVNPLGMTDELGKIAPRRFFFGVRGEAGMALLLGLNKWSVQLMLLQILAQIPLADLAAAQHPAWLLKLFRIWSRGHAA